MVQRSIEQFVDHETVEAAVLAARTRFGAVCAYVGQRSYIHALSSLRVLMDDILEICAYFEEAIAEYDRAPVG